MSGGNGHDLRLVSDITLARKRALKSLNLDETDTTSKELFFALRHRAVKTNVELENALDISSTESSTEAISKIIAFIDTLEINRDVWAVKHAVIKQILKKHCPKKTLKLLGLRSIDSVLKRTNANEILALAYQVETVEWKTKLHGYYKKLKPTDFQATTSQVFVVNELRTERLQKGGYNTSHIVVPNHETGTIMIVPPAQRFKLDTLALTLALLQTLYELRVYSAYFRLISVKDNFGTRLHKALHGGLNGKIQETEIGWKVLQRHFSHTPATFKTIEQPHLQHEDVLLVTPLNALVDTIPQMKFWDEYSYVYMADNQHPVSLHLLDVVTNASNELSYENSVHMHLSQQLWEELGLRYLQHEVIQRDTIKRFEDVQEYL